MTWLEKPKLKFKGKLSVHGIIGPEVVFRRALTSPTHRQDVNLETVLSHSVGPVPASMFHDDCTMRKCVKADHAHGLEDGVNTLMELNNANIKI